MQCPPFTATVRPRLTAHTRFPQKYPDRRGNRITEHTYCICMWHIKMGGIVHTCRSKGVASYIHVDGSYAVYPACTICKTSEKNDKCMHPADQGPHWFVQLPDSNFCKPRATGYDEAICTHFNQFVHKIMHRYADREVQLYCMRNVCCTSVTSDFLPDGEGSG